MFLTFISMFMDKAYVELLSMFLTQTESFRHQTNV